MPKKIVVTAHFKNLHLQPKSMVENALVFIWVSPEQLYYQNRQYVQAMVDLVNVTFNPDSCTVYIVVSGYLQRFNYAISKYGEFLGRDWESAAQIAMDIGVKWYKNNKDILACLKPVRYKFFWQEILTRPEYLLAKRDIDGVYESDPTYRASFQETARIFYKSKSGKQADEIKASEEVFMHNSQEYLREECAFLKALPKLFPIEIEKGKGKHKEIVVVYPKDMTPAISKTLDFTQQISPNIMHWFCADLKQRDAAKFDLQAARANNNPHIGCSSEIESLMQTRGQGKFHHFFKSPSSLTWPQDPNQSALITMTMLLANGELSQVLLSIPEAGTSPPKAFPSEAWHSFLAKVGQIEEVLESSSSLSEEGSVSPRDSESSQGSEVSDNENPADEHDADKDEVTCQIPQ